mmetsp:Transcript_15461/g.27131  ORF Transcript_15461/g.27131 Transcript_15461/m.27131 type:complete len:93 (+) Transcript_15461:693-971(+)
MADHSAAKQSKCGTAARKYISQIGSEQGGQHSVGMQQALSRRYQPTANDSREEATIETKTLGIARLFMLVFERRRQARRCAVYSIANRKQYH